MNFSLNFVQIEKLNKNPKKPIKPNRLFFEKKNPVFSNPVFNDKAKRGKITVERNYHYKERESINSVQSPLKSHSLWVTLYLKNKK